MSTSCDSFSLLFQHFFSFILDSISKLISRRMPQPEIPRRRVTFPMRRWWVDGGKATYCDLLIKHITWIVTYKLFNIMRLRTQTLTTPSIGFHSLPSHYIIIIIICPTMSRVNRLSHVYRHCIFYKSPDLNNKPTQPSSQLEEGCRPHMPACLGLDNNFICNAR